MRNPKRKLPNAHKHGVFAAPAIIPGEDPQEFAELLSALYQEWMPDGATEEDAVLSIAKSVWRKRRVQKFLGIQFFKDSLNPGHPSYNEKLALAFCALAMDHDPMMAFQECRRCLRSRKLEELQEAFPRSNYKTTKEWAGAVINELVAKWERYNQDVPPALAREAANMASLMLSAAYLSDDILEKELALDERLEAMTDRAIKRLIQLKAMKPMLNLTSTDSEDSLGKTHRTTS
jgi:hypothetical protein